MERKLRLALYAKMFIGFVISFSMAEAFHLPYSYTAGVIAVLNLWYSRENVWKTALIRLISSVVGLAVSALLFFAFGYNLFNLFFMVFAVLSTLYLLKLEYGATIALVLIGQQWSEQTTWAPLNALFIMMIGTLPALLLNFFTFKKSHLLEKQKKLLDNEIAVIFSYFKKHETYDFTHVRNLLEETQNSLKLALENYKVDNIMQTFDYINMRADQINVLERIVLGLNKLSDSPYKTALIDYLILFETKIGEENYAAELLIKHDELLAYYRELDLPKKREEFEHRALLYATLNEIKVFLEIKINYHNRQKAI